MSKDIRINKGLDIKLVGLAEKHVSGLSSSKIYAVKPADFHGVVPKIVAREGAELKAGQTLFFDKGDERVKIVSPVSGKVVEVIRGDRRKIIEIRIEATGAQDYHDFGAKDSGTMSADEIKEYLLAAGCWNFVKRRPYDIVADANETPKAIFVSGYNSAPLAADYDFTLQGKEKELQIALTAISKLTEGRVHVSVKTDASPLSSMKGVELHKLYGKHPIGNVSTQIAQVDPINKGEIVWVISPQDLVVIGELFLTGKFNLERTIALTGSKFEKPQYVRAIAGARMSEVTKANLVNDNTRLISGNVLTGTQVEAEGFFGYYDNQITAIPEGDDYDMFGWARPIFDKISTSKALTFSWLFPNKKYDLTTNTNGEHRAFVVTGSYEEVFPLDIYPMQLLKACMYKDLDEMEGLGAYEVAPEDFALTEFVCVSKQPHQKIIREALDLMREEIG